jgi:signal transduction histidine kinase
VHRYPRIHARLAAAWRAGARPPWTDVALAAVLGIAAAWLATRLGHGDGPVKVLCVRSEPTTIPLPCYAPVKLDYRLQDVSPRPAVSAGLNLLMTLPLVWRRRWPLIVLTLQFVGLVAFQNGVNAATFLAVVIGAYSLARYGRSTVLSIGALVAASTMVAFTFNDTSPDIPGWAGAFVILLPVGLFGTTIRVALHRVRASVRRADALEQAQEEATRAAVEQERARIARELHDVVSHHVSVMTIQAGAAGKVIDARPELARNALGAIEASGREAMAELRHLLGVLTPSAEDDLLHPQPGLDQLDALVDKVRGAGQPVAVRRTPAALPRGVDLTAYRVIQEALTNALRYAPGAHTEVAISVTSTDTSEEELVVEVTNDGSPANRGSAAGQGTGTGLLGLAERLRLYQGTLETGRRLSGGFSVRARIPLEST